MLRVRLLILVTIAWVSTTACAQSTFPGDNWEYVPQRSLTDRGWDADGLQGVRAFARDSSNTTGLMVVHKGRVVMQFGDLDELSYLASVRKSILAMLYGNYVEDGTVDLNATLEDLGIDDIQGLTDQERQATVDHMITARSGIYHPASNGGDSSADAPPRGSQTPGDYYLYNNWDFNAAGHIFELTTGRNIYDALGTDLAEPLGFQDWDRGAQQKSGNTERSRYQAYHIWLSTRDMARVGLLMLNDGTWDGTQILSKEWAQRIRSIVTPLEEMNPARYREGHLAYGYMWWVWDGPRAVGAFEGAYSARGAYGQYITVLPAIDLVVAHKTKAEYGRRTSSVMFERILERVVHSYSGGGTNR